MEGKPLTKSYGRSSYLLLMIEEICLSLPTQDRDMLLNLIHQHIVLGVDSKGRSFEYEEAVELVSWAPPTKWEKLMLTGELQNQIDNGVSITTGNFERYANEEELAIADRLTKFVEQSRERYPLKRETNLPLPVLLLACVKFRNPIPPEFWRAPIFEADAVPTPAAIPLRDSEPQ